MDYQKVRRISRQYKQILILFCLMFFFNIGAYVVAPIEFNLLGTILLSILCLSGFVAFYTDYKRWKQLTH